KWTQDTGDFVANMNVVNAIKDNYSEEFLCGQNHYAAFAEQVPNIQAKVITEYYQTINGLFIDHALTPYSKGEVDKDTAIEDFKAAVQNAYPDISVD
ncbi:MAG: carbohydrate ABC transporter substrate-binding protein, partial [Caldibacillus sp.]